MKPTLSFAQKSFKFFSWVVGILLLLALCTLTKVDWSDYQTQDYYHQTMQSIQDKPAPSTQGESWQVGWSNINATPNHAVPLVGYKPRGDYEFIQDSSFIKSLVLGNGITNIAILNYELLIVHPFLAQTIEEAIKEEDLPIDFTYFTATHTHSGIGGYIPGPMGEIAFGGYDEKVVTFLKDKTIEGLKLALLNQDTVSITYQKTLTENLVGNRFITEDPVDPYIRQLVFEKKNGDRGTFLTFSAHSTTLNSKFMGLSGDYPHYLTENLERDKFDFALFSAGTVGSHKPITNGKLIQDTQEYAITLQKQLLSNIMSEDKNELPLISAIQIPIQLRTPHYRISENIRLRPWIFNWLFGDSNAHFDLVLIGNTLLISSSGEISGVFMDQWEELAESKGLNLIVTTFNGGYIGYITPDKYYNNDFYEVREMNFYGPYNGAYFNEMIRKLIEKFS